MMPGCVDTEHAWRNRALNCYNKFLNWANFFFFSHWERIFEFRKKKEIDLFSLYVLFSHFYPGELFTLKWRSIDVHMRAAIKRQKSKFCCEHH